ncbi:probable serine/threonine-protein kinase PBL11 isoform X2 [Mercurialis annua]|uniref:probable serine/threonine-protein kinase PBL11 isoform X2 n=1 Tax=Mercurialis annua TaxID=3986 RepID=UPI00215F1557|nr:probable serine/threonine-protein kinase PBL11 isoform X2 [Mercurialis annua]
MGLCSSAANKSNNGLCLENRGGNELSNGSSSKVPHDSNTVPSTYESEGKILQSADMKNFCYDELKEATENFSSDNLLGEGGFGFVYKGWIDEHSLTAVGPEMGMAVAVKVLKQKGSKGQQEWLAEIKYLGQLYHPNFVKLIGYSLEDSHRILVYEFMPNGSLEKHLTRVDFTGTEYSYNEPLSWNHRIRLALGAAKGLAFLHDEAKAVYRDFRASNILLDSNYNAKLSDFGMAKDVPAGDKSNFTASISGASGYGAPEFIRNGNVNIKIDVYSFGVVLLELISGRVAVDVYRPSAEQILVDWAKPHLNSKRNFCKVFDACLEGKYEVSGALKAAELARQCILTTPSLRPEMKDVVKTLEHIALEMR